MTDWRVLPAAKLAMIEALTQQVTEHGIHVLPTDLHLVLALLRYAQAHDAVTVGDLGEVEIVGADKVGAG